jgi:transcriptional regulator with XRE-family HTH domain
VRGSPHNLNPTAATWEKIVPKPKKIEPTDLYVGQRVKTHRLLKGMTQEGLGDALGITFQQVQKYEKGTNRVSASKLQKIADVLSTSIESFFKGGPADGNGGKKSPEAAFSALLSTGEGIALCKAFEQISSRAVRRSVVSMIETLAKD